MNTTVISAMIFGIIQINVHATINHDAIAGELGLVGQHLVTDKDLAVAWSRDANLVKTMCDSGSPLWKSFDAQSVQQGTGRSSTEICNQNGLMNWYEAKAWIDVLNRHNYLGHSDWRLPRIQQKDTTCTLQVEGNSAGAVAHLGHGCQNSEPGHLFHVSLRNPVHGKTCTDDCLINKGPFHNLSGSAYWTGTEMDFDNSLVGVFDLNNDWQDAESKTSDLLRVWPVYSL